MATSGNEREWAMDLAWAVKRFVEHFSMQGGVSEQLVADALLATVNGIEEFDEGKLG